MKRRTFILTTAAAGTAVGLGIWYKWFQGAKWKNHPIMFPLVLSSFCDEVSLRNIGKSYITLFPSENSKDKLLSSLLKDGINNKQLQSSNYDDVISQLEMKVEKDFREEKILLINGWILSPTEARQCALMSLS